MFGVVPVTSIFTYAPVVPGLAEPNVISVVYSVPPSSVPSFVLDSLNGNPKFDESDVSK